MASKETGHKEKLPKYIGHISNETIEKIYKQLMTEIVIKERYLDANLTAKQLSQEFHTTAHYISGVMSLRFNSSFNDAINQFRIKRATFMMKEKRYDELACEEIGIACGFHNRQSFYNAFRKQIGKSPALYRRQLKPRKKQ